MKRTITILSVMMIAVFFLTACSPNLALKTTALGNASTAANTSPAAPLVASGINPQTDVAGLEGTLENVYQQVNASVVNIQVTSQVQPTSGNSPFGFTLPGQGSGTQVQQGLGSGFVWDKSGIIVTNNHVVDGSDTISVTFSDGFTVPGKVVGKDLNSDLAVVKVDVSADRLQPVTLADSNNVKVGQLAIAIGNPFGLQGTMTMGIISALGRSLPVDSGQSSGSYTIPDVIQTDAPINPGNSGGLLLNEQGQVVGVTAAIESPVRASVGIGYAIPANIVKNVVPVLIEKGSYTYSWLGISGTSLTYDLNQQLKLKNDQRGILVATVTAGGPADKAGLKGSNTTDTSNGQQIAAGGDVILSIDGQAVNTFDDMVSYLVKNTKPGQKVTLAVLRDGKQQNIDITLAVRPENTTTTTSAAPSQQQGNTASGYLGVSGVDLSAEINQAMNLTADQQGALLVQVQKNSPADKAGLQVGTKSVQINGTDILVGGDVITAVDGNSISGMTELRMILQQFPSGHQITLSVLRAGKQMDVQVTLGDRPAN